MNDGHAQRRTGAGADVVCRAAPGGRCVARERTLSHGGHTCPDTPAARWDCVLSALERTLRDWVPDAADALGAPDAPADVARALLDVIVDRCRAVPVTPPPDAWGPLPLARAGGPLRRPLGAWLRDVYLTHRPRRPIRPGTLPDAAEVDEWCALLDATLTGPELERLWRYLRRVCVRVTGAPLARGEGGTLRSVARCVARFVF